MSVIGYRVWKVIAERDIGRLRGAYGRDTDWTQKVVTAQCVEGHRGVRCHTPPTEGHTCGLYAYHELGTCATDEDLRVLRMEERGPANAAEDADFANALAGVRSSGLSIVGAVHYWGRVMRHNIGVRAQYMEVLALELPPVPTTPREAAEIWVLNEFACGLGVSLVARSHLAAVAGEFSDEPGEREALPDD